MSFSLEIISPQQTVFNDEIELCILPGIEGDFGILKNHETNTLSIWYRDKQEFNKMNKIFRLKEPRPLVSKENKILLKSHPNFYNKSIGNQAIWDKIIFDSLKKKIIDKKNLVIIDRSIKNSQILTREETR